VAGTALAPQVGGNIVLSNGQVELPSGAPATSTATTQTADPNALTRPPELDNLNIQLDRNLRITLYPILNFLAVGDMTLSGPLSALRPEGTIQLRSGQVNLFTTQFNLVRGYENTAQFVPGRGLDPLLNVQLATSVPEVTRTPTTSNAPGGAAEINETIATNLGSLDNVRIQASVNGYASQLFDELELTSSPSRSRNEIIALLGGGFVDTLGRGDSTLAIANLAGSALLTGLQNFISSTIGLSDFRLYPTLLPSATTSESTLELASELGLDITGNFSASVLAILTADAPTQFNLRYRINDEFLLRGYIDTDSGTGVILEFETRF
jgi:translocation and assembly module TamB